MQVKHAAVVAGLALGLMSTAARASYIVDFQQVGNNVVATGMGSIDYSASTSIAKATDTSGFITPFGAIIGIGASSEVNLYTIPLAGPRSFGDGSTSFSSTDTGPFVSLDPAQNTIGVPATYVSGQPLGETQSIFDNQTFDSLGLTTGTYKYFFAGSGETLDTFTINIGVSAVPLPASAPMFGAALLALGAVGYGMKRKGKAAA